jgi:hypothetical protein
MIKISQEGSELQIISHVSFNRRRYLLHGFYFKVVVAKFTKNDFASEINLIKMIIQFFYKGKKFNFGFEKYIIVKIIGKIFC